MSGYTLVLVGCWMVRFVSPCHHSHLLEVYHSALIRLRSGSITIIGLVFQLRVIPFFVIRVVVSELQQILA